VKASREFVVNGAYGDDAASGDLAGERVETAKNGDLVEGEERKDFALMKLLGDWKASDTTLRFMTERKVATSKMEWGSE